MERKKKSYSKTVGRERIRWSLYLFKIDHFVYHLYFLNWFIVEDWNSDTWFTQRHRQNQESVSLRCIPWENVTFPLQSCCKEIKQNAYSILPSTFLFGISTYILEESEWKIVNEYSGTIWIIVDKMLHLSKPVFHL